MIKESIVYILMIDNELKCINDKSGPKQEGAGPIPLLPLRLSEREQGK